MDLILALACDDARVRPDGKLDIFGVFNELSAPGFPAAQERMTVVFVLQWERHESGRIPLRADLVDEAGRVLLTIQGHTDVDARGHDRAPAQTRVVLPLEEVVFPAPGSYRFELRAGNTTHRAFSLFVGQRDADPPPNPEPAPRV
ncbi:MAG TPA: hypothetical protein VF192_11060 [Longimicrobiales bacterium]